MRGKVHGQPSATGARAVHFQTSALNFSFFSLTIAIAARLERETDPWGYQSLDLALHGQGS